MRIESGLSTYEKECARLGDDFRKVFEQRAREKKIMKSMGLEFDMNSSKPKAGTKTRAKKSDGKTAADKSQSSEEEQ